MPNAKYFKYDEEYNLIPIYNDDVVEVVRCKDCIFRNEYNECENTSVKGEYDRNRDYFVYDDFFCADGTRRKTE